MPSQSAAERSTLVPVAASDEHTIVGIAATKWGAVDSIEVAFCALQKYKPEELCLVFQAEGGATGGRVRVRDLLLAVAQHHPKLLEEVQARKAGACFALQLEPPTP